MVADLRAALERARDWERHHAPSVPRLYLSRSLEGRVADSITALAGSITFVDLHTVWFGLWVALNAGLLGRIGLSTFVMIAQNRLSDQADARARADYDVTSGPRPDLPSWST
jgi:uncharacterized membrane protein